MNRRQFIASSLIATASSRSLGAQIAQPRTTVTPQGMFLSECRIPGKTSPALLSHEKVVQGIYRARVEYDQSYPDPWQFNSSRNSP